MMEIILWRIKMGQPKRVYNLIEKTCMTEEHLKNLGDPNKFLILTIYNGLMHCGNCGKRMKCATDLMSALKEYTDLDDMLSLLNMDDSESQDMARTVVEIYDILDDNLTENQKYDIVNVIWDNLGLEPEEIVSIFNEIYGKCEQFNKKPIETRSKN